MTLDNQQSYKEIDSKYTGQLILIKDPGMLLINEYNSGSNDQIFDRGENRIYLLVSVFEWVYTDDTYLKISLLYKSSVYTWRGFKSSDIATVDYLDSRFKLFRACN